MRQLLASVGVLVSIAQAQCSQCSLKYGSGQLRLLQETGEAGDSWPGRRRPEGAFHSEVTSEAEKSTSVSSEADGSSNSGDVIMKGDSSVAGVVRDVQGRGHLGDMMQVEEKDAALPG